MVVESKKASCVRDRRPGSMHNCNSRIVLSKSSYTLHRPVSEQIADFYAATSAEQRLQLTGGGACSLSKKKQKAVVLYSRVRFIFVAVSCR